MSVGDLVILTTYAYCPLTNTRSNGTSPLGATVACTACAGIFALNPHAGTALGLGDDCRGEPEPSMRAPTPEPPEEMVRDSSFIHSPPRSRESALGQGFQEAGYFAEKIIISGVHL